MVEVVSANPVSTCQPLLCVSKRGCQRRVCTTTAYRLTHMMTLLRHRVARLTSTCLAPVARFPFVCFLLSCFRLGLVALFFIFPSSLAMRLRVLPLFLTLRLLSRFDYYSFSAFNLNTEHFSHTTLCGLSPAGLSLSLFPFSFPHLLLVVYCLCIAYIVSTTRTRCINTRSTALPKDRQPWPRLSLHSFTCVSEQP